MAISPHDIADLKDALAICTDAGHASTPVHNHLLKRLIAALEAKPRVRVKAEMARSKG